MVNRYYLYPFFVQRLIKVNHNLLNVIIAAVLAVFIFSSTLFATNPPHPNLLKKINAGQMKIPYFLANKESLMQRGVSMPWKAPNNNRSQFGPALVPTGPTNALAIVVDFSDNTNQVEATFFDSLLFEAGVISLRDYYNDVSYGNLDIVTVNLPSSLDWERADSAYSYYVDGQNGFGTYPKNAQKLVEEIVNAVDPLVDFSLYDNDADGFVDALFIIHAGPGAEYTGSFDDIWSHAWTTNTPQSLDGVSVSQYSMEPEYWAAPGDMTIGVYAHELGHALFGLPDLYDRDGSSRGLGSWSLMSGGSWNGILGDSPSFPDAWSHVEMGYITATNVTVNDSDAVITNVEDSSLVFRLWSNGTVGTEYFLVENRQLESYDAALPGDGLLIYHIDESVTTQNDNEWYPGLTVFGHYQVAVEQADGQWYLEHPFGNIGDNGDPYPGSSGNTLFGIISTPNSNDYNSNNTQVVVRNISASGISMTADFLVSFENAPSIAVLPDVIDYGIAFVGYPVMGSFKVFNFGADTLSVTDIASSNGSFSTDTTTFKIPSGNSLTVMVTFNPPSIGTFSETLTITSNDPDDATVIISLLADVISAPIVDVTPDSLIQVLVTGDFAVQTITINNLGTITDLKYNISTFASASVFPHFSGAIDKSSGKIVDAVSSSTVTTEHSIHDYAYMAEQTTNSVLVLNTLANTIVASVPVGSFPHRLEFSPDGEEVWVANKNDETTSVIRTSDNTVTDIINVGYGPFGIAFTPDGRYAYQVIRWDYKVVVIDAATKEIVTSILLPGGGGEGGDAEPKDIAITPDGKYAYVASHYGPVYVIDLSTNTLVETIFGARGGHTIRISRDGLKAYFSEGSSNYPNTFRVLDLSTNTLSGAIGSFDGSEGFDITADGRFAYVMDRWADQIQKIDLITNSVVKVFTDNLIYDGYGVAISADGRYGYATVPWITSNYGIHIFDTETDEFIAHIETDKRIREIITFDLTRLPWLRAFPERGTLIAGSGVNVDLSFDALGLRPGNYGGIIEVNSNDPANSSVRVPVKFKVLPPPIDPPEITSIDDVPDDQGGWVTVSWNASPEDDFFSSTPVNSYSIWLRNDYPAAPAFSENEVLLKSVIQIEQVETNVKVTDLKINKSNLFFSGSKNLSSLSRLKNQITEPNGMTTIIKSPQFQKGEALPKKLGRVMSDHDRWIGIGSIDATQSSAYTFLVHTQVDSNSSGNNLSVIRISAHPDNPFTYATSEPDSGYSVDNKKPSAPAAVSAGMGAEGLVLNWNPIADNDFDFYAIYKSETSGFDASSQDYFATTTDSFYVDSDIVEGGSYYYRLSSFDYNGNESDFTTEINSGIVGIDGERIGIPTEYALAQNYPNPFNPVTNITYSLPKPGRVSLLIYDLKGQVVMRWDDEATQAGYFQKRWNGTNIAGNKVSSGVYLYRLISGDFVQTRKMLLLK